MKSEEDFILNNYNSHNFGENDYLITTEHGSWALLSKGEYMKMRHNDLKNEKELKEFLEEKGVLLNTDNVQKVVRDYFNRKQFLFQGPSLHILTPTLKCNQRCLYCHSGAKGKNSANKFEMNLSTAKQIVDFALQTPSPKLRFEFQGGEPLLNFSVIEKTIGYAKKRGKEKGKDVDFSLVTNLTNLDERKAEVLKKNNVHISTSLDGPKDIHDHNRKFLGGESSYKKLVERIEFARSRGLKLNALCTVTQKSLQSGEEIVDEYIELGFDKVWLRPLNKIGFAKEEWKKIGYTSEEFVNFYKETLDHILKEGKEITELMALIFSKKILGPKDPVMTEIMSPCGAGISQLLYNHKGEIFTCDEGKVFEEFKLGDVRRSEWKDVIKNDTFISMVDVSSKENFLCQNCEWNPYCGICPVGSYSEQGSIVTKLAQDRRCRTYSQIIENIFERLLFSKKQRKVLTKWVENDEVFE